MLPRWRQAFPAGLAARSGDVASFSAVLVWLRLDPGAPAAPQVDTARLRIGSAALIILSDTPNDDEALAVFSGAVRGYCNSHAGPEVLQQVASVVLQGGMWIGEPLMQRLMAAINRVMLPPVVDEDSWSRTLSQRECEVAQIIVAGASNKEIGVQLGISERTVKAHVGAVLEKLQVRDRLQLALFIKGRRSA